MATRRGFLKVTVGTGLIGLGPDGLLNLNSSHAAQTRVTPSLVRLRPEIEPIVQLIENTARDKCFDMMVEQLNQGLPYRHFLAALFLAGIRNVNSQPPGFKFHCVFVIHAAHQASLDASIPDRLLPLFWALDNFKESQQRDVAEGDFRLTSYTGSLPSESRAWTEFHKAMDDWDEQRAEGAIIQLVKSRSPHNIIDGLWRYGARDYRNIGHKAIFVANTWRTLQTIGWQHAEPALRSLVHGLLDFGKDKRVNGYAFEDQSYLPNVERARRVVKKLKPEWSNHVDYPLAPANIKATEELLQVLRSGNVNDATDLAIEQLTGNSLPNHQAQTVWDAVHVAAGELMMRQPGIFGIHTVTSANGLRYAFETAADSETRLLLLLQGIGWTCQFHKFMSQTKAGLKPFETIDLESTDDEGRLAQPEEILALVGKDTPVAARKAFRLARVMSGTAVADRFAREAYKLIFRKGTDAHDYKYAAAIFEDYRRLSPAWRPHILATSVYHLKGSSQVDSPVMERAREAILRIE
jgi:hypothetical protein